MNLVVKVNFQTQVKKKLLLREVHLQDKQIIIVQI
jgi:hypothetical protein